MNYYFDNKETKKSAKTKKKTPMQEVYEWIDAAVLAVIAIILLFTFAFQIVGIKGPSMENTLHDGNRVIISNLFYTPEAGDIVVISRNYQNTKGDKNPEDSPIIKRVIATEGQTVTIDSTNGSVYVDGEKLEEEYIKDGAKTVWAEGSKSVKVEEGHVFVMGDNRLNSLDSRSDVIGQVDTRYILGKAFLRIYPFENFGGLK